MSNQPTLAVNEPFVLAANQGHHLEFLNHLATIKVAAGDNGSMSVVEFLAPQGFGPPLHRHLDEDELFIIFDGELQFHTGDRTIPAGAGAYAFLPRAIPHTFQVLTDSARFVNVTSSTAATPQFDQMVTALGAPTRTLAIPEAAYIDPARVAEVCAAHGIEILGPPPAAITE